jgi:hypothetical protein
MKTLRIAPALIFSLACTWATIASDPGEAGEKWIFEHDGTRPMSNPPEVFDGERTVEVVAVTGTGAKKRWHIKSTWGDNDENPSTAYIDSEKRIHQVDVGAALTLTFAPPPPQDWPDLKPGDETTFETTLTAMGFEVPLKYDVKRLPDETLRVPAGSFTDCRHVQLVVHGTDPQGQTNKTRYDLWLHPKVNNSTVKEVVVSNFESAESHTSTSLLKAHIKP